MLKILIHALLACCLIPSALAEQPAPSAVPDWFTKDVLFHARDGGVWQADNSAYQSEQEPYDAYVLHWQAGPGNFSMTGRMWGLVDGKPTSQDFWSFYQFWNPETQEAIVQQSGWGAVGIGRLRLQRHAEQMQTIMRHRFVDHAGNSNEMLHKLTGVDDDRYRTEAFDVKDGGKQVANRVYLWERRPK
ncbi:MAG: hypothetical protein HKN50_04375 [Gammaproteobacteria bacterium]|nr:hypothetical protein [Gammaproteobacteria bacterium]